MLVCVYIYSWSEVMEVPQSEPNTMQADLRTYYDCLFPYDQLVRWLQYDDAGYFARREFSFTIGDDVYVRYKSFGDQKDLKGEIQRLHPTKIDIGAVYTSKPRESKSAQAGTFLPLEKELVFDIDMTDYDEVRMCCKGTDVCLKCWKFVSVAIKILDAALREDLGFKFIFWVFSGRRGVHCWVCDRRARALTDEQRAGIVEYFQVIPRGKEGRLRSKTPVLRDVRDFHPAVWRAKELVERYFTEIVVDQHLLSSEATLKAFSSRLITDLRTVLEQNVADHPLNDSESRWLCIVEYIAQQDQNSPTTKAAKCNLYEIMFQYVYPCLDIEVSRKMNHLLKAPWVVHPKTGKLSVPIDPSTCETFDPHAVPTVKHVVAELELFGVSSLDEYVQRWEISFLVPLHEELHRSQATNLSSGNDFV